MVFTFKMLPGKLRHREHYRCDRIVCGRADLTQFGYHAAIIAFNDTQKQTCTSRVKIPKTAPAVKISCAPFAFHSFRGLSGVCSEHARFCKEWQAVQLLLSQNWVTANDAVRGFLMVSRSWHFCATVWRRKTTTSGQRKWYAWLVKYILTRAKNKTQLYTLPTGYSHNWQPERRVHMRELRFVVSDFAAEWAVDSDPALWAFMIVNIFVKDTLRIQQED